MIGQRLGSFLLESKIGAGAMGEVFKASQALKDGRARTAAVKVVSADFLERDLALKRFQREAEILAQLRHPNIVRYYAHGKYQGTYYYAMEFVEGETLDDLIEREGFLGWEQVVEFGIQLCQALQYAHDHQVVHRDLKPSNIMITRDHRIKLTDFGIAKDLDATVNLTRTGRTLGTAAYMAPEQIRGTPGISHKTDLYALGCLLYQMLAGKPPFEGKSAVVLMHSHMAEPPPRPSGKTPDVPRALDDLVVQLMAKDPPDRPWDASQVAHLLEDLRAQAGRGDRVPMAFDKGRKQVADAGGVVLAPSNGDFGPIHPSRGGATGTRLRKPPSSKARVAERDTAERRRRALETAGLGTALVGLVALAAYLLWPPSLEALHARAEPLMKSDSRADWKIALDRYVEPIERRFPDHPYGDQFAELRERIALDEARGRAVQLESPTNLGRPRPDRPVEALYKTTISEITPFVTLGQNALVAEKWSLFVAALERRDDPEQRGWVMLGREKREESLEALREQKLTAANLFRQAMMGLRSGLPEEAVRTQLRQLIASYATPARGDAEFLQLISQADAALDRLNSGDLTAPDDDADAGSTRPRAEPDPEPAPARGSPDDAPDAAPPADPAEGEGDPEAGSARP
ncbi:serine/threonine protein kinase [Tautonia plasticadhaerens]|uniref:non-specific serine/threonine protein kinase n=1 Tax=Tautonia plasticadhaerens TaxID=2527974 RepID=A0A518H1X9_9BACT|nr:serine/threonine-protein kinase [Tautonia plasticadhaerens]QDV34833.1 Serine/threonine-protein kinase PrkC [Tautonia plasticadhaerens]